MIRLRKSEMNIIANSMIYQTLKAFDMHSLELVENISEEQKDKILKLIQGKADIYLNNYCNIGNTLDLVNKVLEMRV